MESNRSGKYLMAEDDDVNVNTERTTSDEISGISFQSKKKKKVWSAGEKRTICLRFGQHRASTSLPPLSTRRPLTCAVTPVTFPPRLLCLQLRQGHWNDETNWATNGAVWLTSLLISMTVSLPATPPLFPLRVLRQQPDAALQGWWEINVKTLVVLDVTDKMNMWWRKSYNTKLDATRSSLTKRYVPCECSDMWGYEIWIKPEMSLLFFLLRHPFWGRLSSLVRVAQHSVVLTVKPSESHFLVSFLAKEQKENLLGLCCKSQQMEHLCTDDSRTVERGILRTPLAVADIFLSSSP